jgi:hypothetical protein
MEIEPTPIRSRCRLNCQPKEGRLRSSIANVESNVASVKAPQNEETVMTEVNWIMSTQGNWLDPRQTQWDSINTDGVYVIWAPGTLLTGPYWVKVGQGNVRDRMQSHMRDARITRFSTLRFTFAQVNWMQKDGVERFLGDRLSPLVAERFPDVFPIPVNLPRVA